MVYSKILLYLFCFFSILSILGILIHNDYLFLITKTAVFPCILFYYFNKTIKINYFFLFVLLIFYVVDIVLILEVEYLIVYLAVLLNINHVFILGYAIQNTEKIKIDLWILAFTTFMFMMGFSIQYLIYDLIRVNNEQVALAIFMSGILVSVFNSLALYNYLNRNSYINFYFGFGCLSVGLMYATYDIYKYVYYLDIIKVFSLIFKVIAYYLFIKYMLARERFILKQENIQ